MIFGDVWIPENAEWVGWGVVWRHLIPFLSGGDIFNLNLKNNGRGTLPDFPQKLN